MKDRFTSAANGYGDALERFIQTHPDPTAQIVIDAADEWTALGEIMAEPSESTIAYYADMVEAWERAAAGSAQTVAEAVNGTPIRKRLQQRLQDALKPAEEIKDGGIPVADSENGSDANAGKGKLLKSFADVAYKDPEFLIYPYIPEGKITIVQGDPDAGKTAFCCYLAAAVSAGGEIYGHPAKQRNVIIISTEDEISTLRGRIEADGGDLSRCTFPVDPEDETGETMLTDLTYTDEAIERMVKQVQAGLLIFDPSQAFFGAEVDMFRANQTRPIMAKLAAMAQRNSCAVVIVSHLNKNSKGKAITRGQGSMDIIGAARSALHIGRNPEQDEERLMFHIKSNLSKKGEALSYEISDRGKVTFKGRTTLTVDDLDRTNYFKKQAEEVEIPHESRPIVETYRALLAENPSGFRIPYEDFRLYPMEVLGRPYFATNTGRTGVRDEVQEIAAAAAKIDRVLISTDKVKPQAYICGGKPHSVKDASTACVIVKPLAPLTQIQQSLPLLE